MKRGNLKLVSGHIMVVALGANLDGQWVNEGGAAAGLHLHQRCVSFTRNGRGRILEQQAGQDKRLTRVCATHAVEQNVQVCRRVRKRIAGPMAAEHVAPTARSSRCTNSTCRNNELAGGLEVRVGGAGVVNLQACAKCSSFHHFTERTSKSAET